MRYMGALAPDQEAFLVQGFREAYPQLGAQSQAALYDVASSSGGGADAHLKQRAIFGGLGLVVGLVIGGLVIGGR